MDEQDNGDENKPFFRKFREYEPKEARTAFGDKATDSFGDEECQGDVVEEYSRFYICGVDVQVPPSIRLLLKDVTIKQVAFSDWVGQEHIKRRLVLSSLALFSIYVGLFIGFIVARDLNRLISLLGFVLILAACYICSRHRTSIAWRPVLVGIILQLSLALIVLKTEAGFAAVSFLADMASKFLAYTQVGAEFVYGASFRDHFIFMAALSTIIFFSAFINILYYLGVLQVIMKVFAYFIMWTMGTSGSETLCAVANIFIGQTEAPLLIKPYLPSLTSSELHTIMTSGFATISGSVLGVYIAFGVPATHLISACVLNAAGSLVISKLLFPETEVSATSNKVTIEIEIKWVNVIDAIADGKQTLAYLGALQGIQLVLNICAMLIAFLALLAAANGLVGWLGSLFGFDLTVQIIIGYLLTPLAWVLGIPWVDCFLVGQLLGEKIILNEFVAFQTLAQLVAEGKLSERSVEIAVYAICGFSNLAAIGVQIGGIGGLSPTRKHEISSLGFPAMIAANLACFLTATIAGMII